MKAPLASAETPPAAPPSQRPAGVAVGSRGRFYPPVNALNRDASPHVATITAINEDGTVDVRYPNAADATNPHEHGHVPIMGVIPASGPFFIPLLEKSR